MRRRVWNSLAYPLLLVVLMAAIVVFARLFIIDGFEKIFKDFGVMLPDLTAVVIAVSWPAVWIVLGLLVLMVATPLLSALAANVGWVWWRWIYRVPALGPLLKWGHLAQFSRLMGLFLGQQVSLPDALRLCAAGLRDVDLARGCRAVAGEVESGRRLDESLATRRQFPASLIPIVRWGQQAHDLPDAFRAAAEMFEGRARTHGSLLETILLPVMLLVIMTFVGLFVLAMLMPLIRLITCLSS
jgi:type II secretory pathway component PulF